MGYLCKEGAKEKEREGSREHYAFSYYLRAQEAAKKPIGHSAHKLLNVCARKQYN